MLFYEKRSIDIFCPQEKDVIAFLTKSFKEGSSYGRLNSDRSAISLNSSNKIGENLLIKRFLKGYFKLRPTGSKYLAS